MRLRSGNVKMTAATFGGENPRLDWKNTSGKHCYRPVDHVGFFFIWFIENKNKTKTREKFKARWSSPHHERAHAVSTGNAPRMSAFSSYQKTFAHLDGDYVES